MARIREIVIDSQHPASLARFWASALDGYHVRPYDQDEIDRLAAMGCTPETDPSVAVDGPGPTLFFQKTAIGDLRRGRIHLDLIGASGVEEVQRLIELGATIRETKDAYTVMLDPEGHPFCLLDSGS